LEARPLRRPQLLHRARRRSRHRRVRVRQPRRCERDADRVARRHPARRARRADPRAVSVGIALAEPPGMRIPSLASLLIVTAACGNDVEPPGSDPPPTAQTTWYQNVAPIVATHCMSCHQDGGIAPFSLTTYDTAYIYALQMNDAITQGVMPPFSA